MSRPSVESNESPTKTHNFIPKELLSNKDSNGISRTVFTHISNLHRLLTDWVRIQDKGTKICRSMAVLKLHEYADDYFPQALAPLTESLVDALETLLHIVEGVEIICKQLGALAKLQPTESPVILTWSASRISGTVEEIYNALRREFRVKEVIAENIAHCRDENLIEVYVSSWEFDTNLDIESNMAYLCAEMGLPSIS